MIQITLERKDFFVGQQAKLVFDLTNTGQDTLTNIIFGLKLSAIIGFQSGLKQVEIPQIPPHKTYKHILHIIPKSIGSGTITIFNFSYRDGLGRSRRIEDIQHQITIQTAPSKAEIDFKLYPTILSVKEWGKLEWQVTNTSQISLRITKVEVIATDRAILGEIDFFGRLLPGETKQSSFRIFPLKTGNVIPIEVKITYADQNQQLYNSIFARAVQVTLDMGLPGQQLEKLQDALLNAFIDFGSLEQMLYLKLEKNLRAIVGEGSLKQVVFKLLRTAESEGWLKDLVRAAHSDKPGNQQLKDFAENLGII